MAAHCAAQFCVQEFLHSGQSSQEGLALQQHMDLKVLSQVRAGKLLAVVVDCMGCVLQNIVTRHDPWLFLDLGGESGNAEANTRTVCIVRRI